ncbi:hypothetical protein A0H81_13603 [Grifola frondosa]|uniref:Uncharacterized protein n=1 Tax=Grifola frondosa TaxID=5627 RepID=A0A1C7LPJ2_GRIFR|nr:hypothetical protein A0H81_13603 [Grifola frondosa]
MPRPDYIVRAFDSVPGGVQDVTDENLLCGPYNALQYRPPSEGRFIDFASIFVIKHAQRSVFFLEVKPAAYFQGEGTRGLMDDQMRDHFFMLHDQVKIPVLYGVSALGTHLCLYKCTASSGDLEPATIAHRPMRLDDYAPAERWSLELLSDEEYNFMTELAANITQMTAEA